MTFLLRAITVLVACSSLCVDTHAASPAANNQVDVAREILNGISAFSQFIGNTIKSSNPNNNDAANTAALVFNGIGQVTGAVNAGLGNDNNVDIREIAEAIGKGIGEIGNVVTAGTPGNADGQQAGQVLNYLSSLLTNSRNQQPNNNNNNNNNDASAAPNLRRN